MTYTTTSIEEVFARVIRNTRIQDSSYLVDMNEWIPEAMGYMKTKVALEKRWEDITVNFHKGRMPCGLIALKAIQYGNYRLPYFNGAKAAGSSVTGVSADSVYPNIPVEGTTEFGTHLVKREATDDEIPVEFYQTDIEKLSYCTGDWYYHELDYINTSFECGTIRVHFAGIPVDSRGMPLIPDDELYKEALYWYVRAKMIGAGYNDKVFSEQTCMDRFDTYSQKAMARIRYPSVDEMDAKVARMTRLIMPVDYWSTFFNPESEASYG